MKLVFPAGFGPPSTQTPERPSGLGAAPTPSGQRISSAQGRQPRTFHIFEQAQPSDARRGGRGWFGFFGSSSKRSNAALRKTAQSAGNVNLYDSQAGENRPRRPASMLCEEAAEGLPASARNREAGSSSLGELSSTARTEPLQHHEMQQVGYQVAAKLNGNAVVDLNECRRLAAANQTMHETRLALEHGRGNVAADRAPSGGHNGIGASVAYREFGPVAQAGMSLAVGAGNCDQNALINTFKYSAKLKSGETVHSVTNPEVHPAGQEDPSHSWSEIRARNPHGGSPSKIVMDSWANGPAARLEDTTLAPYAETTKTRFSFDDSEKGRQALDRVDELRVDFSPEGKYFGHTKQELASARARPTPWDAGAEEQIIDPTLAQAARAKLGKMSPLHQEIVAAGTAREAYGLSVKTATKLSTTAPIVDEAGRLDRQDRPPVTKPRF